MHTYFIGVRFLLFMVTPSTNKAVYGLGPIFDKSVVKSTPTIRHLEAPVQ